MARKLNRTEWAIIGFTGSLFLFSFNKQWVESYYSNGLYPAIGRIFRFIFGWIPFSLGDILYTLVIGWIIWKVIKNIRLIIGRKTNWNYWKRAGRKTIFFLIGLYGIFMLCWGLNYNRLGSSAQLNLNTTNYKPAELLQLADTLQQRLKNELTLLSAADTLVWYNFNQLKQSSFQQYQIAEKQYPFLNYQGISIKKMLFGNLGGYLGFSGYFTPFTGEAHLVHGMPGFILPAIMSHEMAHQVGFAAEEEANLIGYLAAKKSTNPAIRYSIYHDLNSYALRELRAMDTALYRKKYEELPLLVKKHHQQIRDYYLSFKTPFRPLANLWYDLYLKANSQSKGLHSYSYVSAWLIAYANKYGWDQL